MRTDGTVVEREAKFDVDRDYVPPDFRQLIGGTERLADEHLRTCYFDTADRRLAHVGLSLRHRRHGQSGDADFPTEGTWTLKIPQAPRGGVLNRTELSWAGDPGTVPAETMEILRGVVRRSELQALVELDTTRRRLVLYGSARATRLAELDDDLVRVMGGSNDGMFFRQIEVELDAADSSEVDVVLARLRRSGAKPSERSKFSIAIGRAPEWEHDCRYQKKRRGETLEQTIAAALCAGLDRLLEHDYRLRVDPRQPHPEDIHQARVAARRLRSDLRTFAAVLDPVWVRHMNDDLSWIGTVLGRVRDVDVRTNNLSEQVARLGAGGSGFASIQAVLDGQRDQAAEETADALRSVRYLDLLDRLDAAQRSAPVLTGAALPADSLAFGPDSKASSALPDLVGDQWRALRRKVRKAGRDPDDEALHEIRIRAKRLRYAAETAEPIVGKPAAKTARRAEAIQSVLGDLHDTVTAESWLATRQPGWIRSRRSTRGCSPETSRCAATDYAASGPRSGQGLPEKRISAGSPASTTRPRFGPGSCGRPVDLG